jgi:hypothetical protein
MLKSKDLPVMDTLMEALRRVYSTTHLLVVCLLKSVGPLCLFFCSGLLFKLLCELTLLVLVVSHYIILCFINLRMGTGCLSSKKRLHFGIHVDNDNLGFFSFIVWLIPTSCCLHGYFFMEDT